MTSPPPAKKFKQSTIWEGFKRQVTKPKVITKVKEVDTDLGEASAGLTPCAEVVRTYLPASSDEDEDMSDLTEEERREREKARQIRLHAAERRLRESQLTENVAQQTKASKPASLPVANKNACLPNIQNEMPGGAIASSSHSPQSSAELTPMSPTEEYDNDLDNSEPLFDTDPASPVYTAMMQEELKGTDYPEGGVTLGIEKHQLNRSPECRSPLPTLKVTPDNQVLVQVPLQTGEVPHPFPCTLRDRWDNDHVKMPYSKENLYPVDANDGKKELKNRWELIELALKDNLMSSFDLEEAIIIYNTRYAQKWDFTGLHAFFTERMGQEQTTDFFKNTLPKMVDLTLRLPYICTQPLRLLKQQENQSVTFSQEQAACLLANAFFCTYPRRNARGKQAEYATYPDINFNILFTGNKGGVSPRRAEKLKCIVNYFRRVTTKMPCGMITMKRQNVPESPGWVQSQTKLTPLYVTSEGTIEAGGVGMLQVDFANKYLGGGVLRNGCVQEEIRFLLCPEMILSRLITQVLDFNECLIMIGCEQFNDYTGYADTFRWTGNHVDQTPRDEWGRRCVEVVAIDALVIHKHEEQFKAPRIRRELDKAYCGFYAPGCSKPNLPAVATGNWGCGAFGGDLRLKALIQMMATSEAGRSIAYYTFGDARLARDIHSIHAFIRERQLTIADLWAVIKKYNSTLLTQTSHPKQNLFEFIFTIYNGMDMDIDEKMPAAERNETMRSDSTELPPSPDWAIDTP